MMKFNKKRYRELLKYSEKLKRQQKFIADVSESDYMELLSYSVKTYKRLQLELLNFYLNLIEKFLEEKICAGALFFKYVELENWHDQIHDQLESHLIILSPQEEEKFDPVDDLLTDLYWILEEMSVDSKEQIFEAVVQTESYYEALAKIKARDLHNSIKEIYLELQKIVKNYRSDWQNSKDFSMLVDQLNWETREEYIELIEEFLDESSNFLKFKEKYQSILKVAKELESNSIFLKPNYQALGFSNYLLILIQLFESYQINAEISPKVFKSWVRKILCEIENHYF